MNNIIRWKFSKQKLIYALSVPLHSSSSSNSTKRASFQSKCSSSLVYRETIKELSEMSVANENESSSPQSGGGALLERKRAAFFRGVSFLQFLYSIYRQRCTPIFHDYARSSFRLPEENSFSSLDRLVIVSTGQEGTGMRADKLNYLRNLSLLFPSSILPSLLLTIIIKGCCVNQSGNSKVYAISN